MTHINRRYTFKGHVQGVGFRPHIFVIAKALGLPGRVFNKRGAVVLELTATTTAHEEFLRRFKQDLPPQAQVQDISIEEFQSNTPFTTLYIDNSESEGPVSAPSVDFALCESCKAEMLEEGNRRFHYPFISCADCGPRYSIIHRLPFDRRDTAMAPYNRCVRCEGEYQNPSDRRFWAQTTCCQDCGPRLNLITNNKELPSDVSVIDECIELLRRGEVLAVKNTGGYQLLVDASNQEAVEKLRTRKGRPTKPFALVFQDINAVQGFVELTARAEAMLTSSEAPIVISPRVPMGDGDIGFNSLIAPNCDEWGVMLAHSPLLYLITQHFDVPLVCTSANFSGDLMLIDDAMAPTLLGVLADGVLSHDREILHRVDDSVYRQTAKGLIPMRLGRGSSPLSLEGASQHAKNVLAFGADMKASFCLARDGDLICSPYMGALHHESAYRAMVKEIKQWLAIYDFQPDVIACDAHPDYFSSKMAREFSELMQVPLITVLHHQAHLASLYAEHAMDPQQQVLGLVIDGLGWGDDSTLWGMEFFSGKLNKLQRFATAKAVSLPSSERAIQQPWRQLVGHLQSAGITFDEVKTVMARVPSTDSSLLESIYLVSQHQGVQVRSLGRLFDALAYLLIDDLPVDLEFEGQGPMALERLARRCEIQTLETLPVEKIVSDLIEIDFAPAWKETLALLESSSENTETIEAQLAYRWHLTIVDVAVEVLASQGARLALNTVLLSGGCMQNVLLHELFQQRLEMKGYQAITHIKLPANDGAISAGQAYYAQVQ